MKKKQILIKSVEENVYYMEKEVKEFKDNFEALYDMKFNCIFNGNGDIY